MTQKLPTSNAGSAGPAGAERFSGARIIALSFIIMNLALGLTYGTFGALVLPMAERFDARVSVVSLGMSLIVSTTGLLALAIGMAINRFSIKAVMAAGSVLASAGYATLAFCTGIGGVLVSYGLLIGPGIALLGFLPCYTLISRWYVERQGRAFGIIGLPLVVMVMPLVVTRLLPVIGFEGVVLAIAAGYLLALPFVWLVIDRPVDVGQVPLGKAVEPAVAGKEVRRLTLLHLVRDPAFLLIVLASGLTVSPQVAKAVHLMPIIIERGFEVERAALLLSISGGAAIMGSIAFGALADRISAAVTLMIVSTLQALTWLIVIAPSSFPLLILDAVVMGACGGGFTAPKSVLVSRVFGSSNYALVMGASGLATLPFMFGMPPLMGILRESTGDYLLPVILQIAGLCIAAFCFLLVRNLASEGAVAEPSAPTRRTAATPPAVGANS